MLQEIEREILIEAYKKKIRLGKGARQSDVSEDKNIVQKHTIVWDFDENKF